MKIVRRTGGGRGVYELAAVQDAGLRPEDLRGMHLVLELPGDVFVPTLVEYTGQGGKPRLRIDEEGSHRNGRAVHIHRQLAALLLLSKPTRSDSSVGHGLPILAPDAYFLEEAIVRSVRVDGIDLIIGIDELVLANADNSARLSFAERLAGVTRVWSEAENYPESTRDLILAHRDHVLSGAPLGADTERLIVELLRSIDSELPLASASTEQVDPTLALHLMTLRAPFQRDELILLLDLYFRVGACPDGDGSIVAVMAGLLTKLAKMNGVRAHRVPDDILRGLSEFADTERGLPPSELIGVVWSAFEGDRDVLRSIVQEIRRDIQLGDAPAAATDDEEMAFPEGRQLYRRHRQRERSGALVRQKKADVLRSSGRLVCESCGFDFGAVYHELGDGYIECHHDIPVSEYVEETGTHLEDLSLVCANCHRVLHRRRPWLSATELRLFLDGATS